ncbi:MAG: glycoside hydrolase family 18 protein [Polyangiales bacterium]
MALLLAVLVPASACTADTTGAGSPSKGDPGTIFTPAGDDAGDDDTGTSPTPASEAGANDSGASTDDSGSVTPAETGTTPTPGKREVVAYFAAWAVYGRNFHIPDVDASLITRLNYAFANIAGGECVLGDSYADTDKFYPGDTWDAGALRGSFHQLQLLKAKFPTLKTVLSIGGWTWSSGFSDAAATDASREKFAKSCAALAEKYGFDGLDVDWEYPGGGGMAAGKPEDTQNFTKLLAAMRTALGPSKLLTIAAPAGPAIIKQLEVGKIHPYLDSINIMTYDFHGAWEKQTGHNSPLFASPGDPSPAGWNTDGAVKAYLAGGVPAGKIIVGGAFYGRGWSGVPATNHGLFQSATGASPGTIEAGILDWHDLVANYLPTYEKHVDDAAGVPFLYDAAKQIFISYDDPASLGRRAKYVKDGGLGGIMIWELSSDDKAHTLGKAVFEGVK